MKNLPEYSENQKQEIYKDHTLETNIHRTNTVSINQVTWQREWTGHKEGTDLSAEKSCREMLLKGNENKIQQGK